MTTPVLIPLTNRSLIRVAGDDAHHFLQNLITSDLEVIDRVGAGSSALLTPQGKIQFDFLIYREPNGYLIDVAEEVAADLLKRLTFYRLRAKVTLEPLDAATGVFAVLSTDAPATVPASLMVKDPRLAQMGYRIIGAVADLEAANFTTSDLAAYDAHRIALGVPEGLKDYDFSDIFPHDADLDQLNGVSFSKGCYVGQEVVSRVHHRGTARKRFVQLEATTPLPDKGADIMADGKSIGTVGSSIQIDGQIRGLGLLRLDKVRQAIDNGSPLTCGDATLNVTLPEWAAFGWPERKAAE